MDDIDIFGSSTTTTAPASTAKPAGGLDDMDFFLTPTQPPPAQSPTQPDFLDFATPAQSPQQPQAKPGDKLQNLFDGGMDGFLKDFTSQSQKNGNGGAAGNKAGGQSLKQMQQAHLSMEDDKPKAKFGSNSNNFYAIMNHYELLGVARNAAFADIRKAYLKKSIALHPDKNPNQHEDDKELFKRITEAYDELSDEDRRRFYDQKLLQGF